MPRKQEDNPYVKGYVNARMQEQSGNQLMTKELCDARMQTLETKLKYLFGTSLITIVLIIIQLVRGL